MSDKKDQIIINNILGAAQALMQQFGLDKTTMADIAKKAGKGKSTLYYYFKSKEEVFDRVINMEIDNFFVDVKSAVEKASSFEDKLRTYIVTRITKLKQKANLYRLAIETDVSSILINKHFQELRKKYDDKEKELLISLLNHGVNENVISILPQDIITLSGVFISCLRGIEMDLIINKRHTALADKANFLINVLIKGLK